MQAVLRASPAARRIVRSMLWMLSDQPLHDSLKQAPRPRKPKPVRDEAERKRWLATRRVVGRRPAAAKKAPDPLEFCSPEERIMMGKDPGCRDLALRRTLDDRPAGADPAEAAGVVPEWVERR